MDPSTKQTHKTVQPERGGPADPAGPTAPRKLFSTGEWLTLFGMVSVVMSASQPWVKVTPPALTSAAAAYMTRTTRLEAGFEVKLGPVNVGYAAVAAGVICALMLLNTPTAAQKRPFLIVQTILSAAVLGLACYHAGPYLGIYLAAAGALMLLAGGVLRYRS